MKQILLWSSLLCFSLTLFAQSGPHISVQGILKDIKDVTVSDGTYELTFRLYEQQEDGIAVFEEVANVEILSGVYSHLLGSVETLNPSMFGQTLYLGITANDQEMEPRGELTYAPYAMAVNTAINADTADYVRFGMVGGSSCSGRIGDVKYSVLPLTEFKSQNGDCWRLMDGSVLPVGNALRDLTTWENVPDARGVFLRAHDDRDASTTQDEDRQASGITDVGTFQQDGLSTHAHRSAEYGYRTNTGNYTGVGYLNSSGTNQYRLSHIGAYSSGTVQKTSTLKTAINTDETRPKNINLYLYIRVE